MSEWQIAETAPLDVEVMTKIDDDRGERNVQTLVQRQRTPQSRPIW